MTSNDRAGRAATPAKAERAPRVGDGPVVLSRTEFAAPRPPHDAPAGTHADIQVAAYLRWRKYGGDALGNWLASEREIGGRGPGAPRVVEHAS